MLNKRLVGKKYENIAKDYLSNNSYNIISQNFMTHIGEIDIIAENEGYLCFVEVKYREKNSLAKGFYAVDRKKQQTIFNVAKIYMLMNGLNDDTPCRFDVVSIDGDEISLIKNAFP